MDFNLNIPYFEKYIQIKTITSTISLQIKDFIDKNANKEELFEFLKNLNSSCHEYTFPSILLKISKNQAHSNEIISENSDSQNEPLFMKKLYVLIVDNIDENIFCELFLQTEKIENLDDIQMVDEVIFFSDFLQRIKNKKFISNIVKYLNCIVYAFSKRIECSYKNSNMIKKEFAFCFLGGVFDFIFKTDDFSTPLSLTVCNTLKSLDYLGFAVPFFILNILRKNDLMLSKKKSLSEFFGNKYDSYFFIYGFIFNLVTYSIEKHNAIDEIVKRITILTNIEITNEKIIEKFLAFIYITNDELFIRISYFLIDRSMMPKIKIIYSILKTMRYDTNICIDFLLSEFEFLQMLVKILNAYLAENKTIKILDDFFRQLKLNIEHTRSEFGFDITPLISKINLIIKKT